MDASLEILKIFNASVCNLFWVRICLKDFFELDNFLVKLFIVRAYWKTAR